jgi:hypothetical protein
VLNGTERFATYAIASAKGLIPEMENAVRLTLDHPMTFESIGEGLRLFEGPALRDLVNFRKRCSDNLVTCYDSFLEVKPPGPSSIWIGCPEVMPSGPQQGPFLPRWLYQLLSLKKNDLKHQNFTHPFEIYNANGWGSRSRIRQEYTVALEAHSTCDFCSGVNTRNGSTFCAELESKLTQARNKVFHSLYFSCTTN